MTNLKKKLNRLILVVLFVSYFIVPFIGNLLFNNNNENDLGDTINLDSLPSSLMEQTTSNDFSTEINTAFKTSKFDDSLKNYLLNHTINRIYAPENIKIVVLFEDTIDKETRIKILDSIFEDYKVISNYDIISGVYLKLDSTQLIENENLIQGITSIKKIYKSQFYQLPYIEEDSLQLSALNNNDYSNWWLPAIGAENLPYNGTGVRVAVIDTGIYDHPDLNIIENRNFVTDESILNYNDGTGHGTHVAGIIAGDGSGSSGQYRGVAPGALLINARAGNESGLADVDIVDAIQWSSISAGADIISMSFGGGYPNISDIITLAITNAKDTYGVISVASAGNSGPEYFIGSTPASGVDVISVGATDESNSLASFSSWGPTFGYLGYPDVVAPGVHIISTEAQDSTISKEQRYKGDYFDLGGDAYIPLSGTSMSCPMVAGTLAILKEAYPNITPETARIALIEGARKLLDENDDDILKSGAGLINVTASLNYLDDLSANYNDTAKIFPDDLPIKPYDLLHFPGDHQKFNLTVISGESNTYNLNVSSNIQGVSLSLDKSTIIFSEPGVKSIEVEITINKNAFPGLRNLQINLTIGAQIYDTVDIELDLRLPEHRILLESYHGLNDWFPEPFYSFYQMGFYEAMADLSDLNISIDYDMEHWTPDYNKDVDNSILTEERIAQYDIIFLQSPILPYSSLEINNLVTYFENGGNILFLGTRYQDLVVENINYLFSRLGVDIQINEENIMNDNWLGLVASITSQSVTNFNNPMIFNGVSQFYWKYGNTFNVSNNAESIATINGKTVTALYNGTTHGKGHFLAFGDLHWIFTQFESSSYSPDHSNLLKNIIDFFLPSEEVSINIDLNRDRISNPTIDVSLYLKNQVSESPITNADFTSLNMIIKNGSYSKSIILNNTFNNKGIYFNDSFDLPYPSYSPYSIEVNLTIGSKSYIKATKILYFDSSELPQINDLFSVEPSITRAAFESTNLIAEMDKPTYIPIRGYLSIYSSSFFNSRKSVNKTLTLSHTGSSIYSDNFDPEENDPSGYAIYYITPMNLNYTTPNSPRFSFRIINNAPTIFEASSTFNYDGYSDKSFEDTKSNGGSWVYSATQGDTFNFEVDVGDTFYEDNNSNMRVFVNLFICSVTDDGYLILIFPHTFEVAELSYQSILDKFEGSFTIPDTMQYSSITGTKSLSTAADYDQDTNKGYLSILYIKVYDSEGGTDDFIIILSISQRPMDVFFIIIIVVAIFAIIVIIGLVIYFARRKKRPRISQLQPRYQDYYYPSSDEEQEETYLTPRVIPQPGISMYCPFCGEFLSASRKFCPHCGESLEFFQKND